MQQNHRISAKW